MAPTSEGDDMTHPLINRPCQVTYRATLKRNLSTVPLWQPFKVDANLNITPGPASEQSCGDLVTVETFDAVICEVTPSGLIVARADGTLVCASLSDVALTDTAHLARVLDPQNATLPRWFPAEEVPVGTAYLALIEGRPSTFKGADTPSTMTERLKRWGIERKAFFLIHPANLPEGA